MVDFLLRWSLSHRGLVLGLAVLMTGLGAFVAWRMPLDVFPDLTAPTVTVVVEGSSMSPGEMETLVTLPIETAVNGAPDVRRVRSGTALGIAVVWIEFEWGTDIQRARQAVAERLAAVAGELPALADAPRIMSASSIMGEVLFLSLTSTAHDAIELRSVAETRVRRRLLAIPGVSQATPIGGEIKEIHVVLSPERLRAHSLSASVVADALAESNENISAGVLVAGAEEAIIEGIGRARDPADLARTVVAWRDGTPVLVSDLGEVRVGAAFTRGIAAASRRAADGSPIIEQGVIVAVQKQPGANTLELTRRLDLALDEVQASLPAGMHINKDLFRQANFIEASVRNTTLSLLEGALVVVLIVVAFLASLRASLVTLVALPLSLFTAVLALASFGGTINTMTLGGMAIAIGVLVDDAIIDVENVVRRLRENRRLPEAARRPILEVVHAASLEVRSSIVLATFLIVLVFAPIFVLSGVEGRLLQPLGLAFVVALGASLLTALTVTPVLCSLFLPTSAAVGSGAEPRLVRALKSGYAPLLGWAMRRPLHLACAGLLLLAAGGWAISRMGRNFLPEFNEGALVVGLVTVPGASLEQSDQLARLAEEALMRHPEIAAIGRRTGRAAEDEHIMGVEASEIDLTLDMEAPLRLGARKRTKDELLAALRADLAAIPGLQATFGQPLSHRIDHMLSGTRASIAVKIFGDDLAKLRELGARAEAAMEGVEGLVDLSVESQALVPTLRVEFDREALARHGVRVADAARALSFATRGEIVGQVREDLVSRDLLVRVGDPGRISPTTVGAALVDAPDGARIPLRLLARIEEDRAPNFISRENVQRKIVVTANVAGRDVRGVVEDIRRVMEDGLELPTGYHVEYGGQFESAEATTNLLLVLGLAIVACIGGLLRAAFGSTRDALLVLLNLPLALIGGVAGVHLAGGVLSVASLIGFITVFGVAARNGIMLVSHIRHLQREEGVADFAEAVRRGALERLAPILMTACAAGLALVPIALRGDEPGNEILTPMAIVILCGLASSTLLNMLATPALFLRFGERAPAESHGQGTLGAVAASGADATTEVRHA
jgi:CzcA family heavy metal efflux pump